MLLAQHQEKHYTHFAAGPGLNGNDGQGQRVEGHLSWLLEQLQGLPDSSFSDAVHLGCMVQELKRVTILLRDL